MMTRHLAVLSTAALAALACAEPVAPPVAVAVHMSDAASPGVVGSGHVEQGGGLREFTFHAIDSDEGGAKGSFKIVLASGLFFEADVTCLAVVGNTGWVAGHIRASNAAAVVLGSVSTFFVIDNGESGGVPDIVSNATFNGAAGADVAFCADRPLVLPQLTVTDGNVQVR